MSFNLSEVIHIISTIDDLLSMTEYPYAINTSTGYDNDELFVEFVFPLRNGKSHVKIYNSTGLIVYENLNGEILTNIEFGDRDVFSLNGSFKKAFKQIREFDRQQVNTAKSNNTLIDRASFGLAEVN
jgi:hypothetical protein